MSNNRYPVVFWAGTQAEYNALTTKSNNTIYFLTDINAMYRGSQRFGGDVTVEEARRIAEAVLTSGGYITSSGGSVIAAGKVSSHNTAANAHKTLFNGVIKHVASMPVDIPSCVGGALYLYTGTGEPGCVQGHIYRAYHDEVTLVYEWEDLTPTTSGAIISGAEFVTTVGGYTVALTSGGGVSVSGSGAMVALSGGQIVASGGGVQFQVSSGGIIASAVGADDYGNSAMLQVSGGDVVVSRFDGVTGDIHQLLLSDGAIIASGASGESVVLSAGEAKLYATDGGNEASVNVWPGGVSINGDYIGYDFGTTINGRPVLTALVTSTDTTTTAVSGGVLSGGTSIIYTQPLTVFGFDSITSDARAEFDFTAASGATLAFASGAGIKRLGLSSLDSGAHYLVAVNGARVVVNSYTIVGE